MSSDELQLIPLDASPRIVEVPAFEADAELLARIEAVWVTAPESSFDGCIFNVHKLDQAEISGAFVPYRYYFAARHDASIAVDLALLPLGVSGVVRSVEGILFGRRTSRVLDCAGVWELAPSGGVSPDCRRQGEVSLETQLLAELAEETPFAGDDVANIAPLVLAVQSDIIDVCFHVDIESSKPLAASNEYRDLRWVRDTPTFLEEHDVLALSRHLVQRFD